MNLDERIRRAIGDYVIQIHTLLMKIEELEAKLAQQPKAPE